MAIRKLTILRITLFKLFSLEGYLKFVSRLYFIAYDLKILKLSPVYHYPYFLKNILKQGDTCIDIGANLGYISYVLSKAIGKDGKVYAIEPVEPIMNAFKWNTRKQHNIEYLQYALGKEAGEIFIGNDSISKLGYFATGSNFVVEKETDDLMKFKAEMKTCDELFGNINKVDFIKIDIEGYEGVVVPELANIINKHQPIFQIETFGDNRTNILNFLTDKGYKSFMLQKGKLYQNIENTYLDLLFVPTNKMNRIEKYIDD